MQLVLASTSRYRQELLKRLRLPFSVAAPGVDERSIAGEPACERALRLAIAKARAVRSAYPHALIIGSDQVAAIDGALLDKPGNRENAVAQLQLMRGKTIPFFTAVCVLNAETAREQSAVVTITVHMRTYSDAEIARYVDADEPYDCSGSARVEAFGITLIEKLIGDDPNALIGLPLIKLCDMLRAEGIALP